ncbi:topology modulation protein [Novosphingobium sp.]|uniref:topology modulation protein n=1 Tax=Novosphingobium sp. TaxID=1874826 RepID=UPI0025F5A279|nr:topology modulation protein [Novosphingobium sp.]
MQRVLIIGSPGSGKSTLSKALSARTGLPLFHLDQLFWTTGWVERDKTALQQQLAAILAQDRWILDGNYGSSLPLRIARADTVIRLDYPTWLCLCRVLRRWWHWRGQTRPDMTAGCPERIDLPFLRYVLNFRRGWAKRNSAALNGFGGQIVTLSDPDQAAAWLSTL